MTKALHLSLSAERYTPEYIIAPGREVLGGFDLDPASCDTANSIVKAASYLTARDNGLAHEWDGRLFLNPPGTCKEQWIETDESGNESLITEFPGCGTELPNGKARKVCSCDYVLRFWEKLIEHVDDGSVSAAIWIGFNPSQLQMLQQSVVSPLDFPTCFLDKRVRYLGPDLQPMNSPPHNSYVTLVAPPGSPHEDDFAEAYSRLGVVTRRYL